MFADESWDELYASHVLEHVTQARFAPTLGGLYRILRPGGKLMISVPDLEILCRLFIHPQMTWQSVIEATRMMFGGQDDEFDFHYIGLSYEFLSLYLAASGFENRASRSIWTF